jgi:outer membrane receptor protein involved in Fe transport
MTRPDTTDAKVSLDARACAPLHRHQNRNGRAVVLWLVVNFLERRMRNNTNVVFAASLSLLLAAPVYAAAPECGNRTAPAASAASSDESSPLEIKVVTASKFAESISDAPGVMSVVSRDELDRWGGVTLAEVLNRVPGLNLTSAYFTDRSIVAARGDQTKINGGHVLFLINGRPTREVLEGGLVSDLLESFPVSALDHIEVIKGPGSVLYGSNAFSAVVNLITLKHEANGFSASARPGGNDTLASSGEGTYSCGSFSLMGAAQLHQMPDWKTTYTYPSVDQTLSSMPTPQSINIVNRSQGAYMGASYRGLNIMSSFTDWQTASFVQGTVGQPRWKRGFADVGYDFNPSSRWTSSVNYTYTRNTFGTIEFPDIRRDSSEQLLEWTNIVHPTNRDQLTLGALYTHQQGGETYYGLGFPIPISIGDRNGSGGYAQLDHLIVTGLKGIVGLQANKIGDLSTSVVPRGGVIWVPNGAFSVKALYGQAFRAPSINETTLNHPALSGNPNLLPEKVGTFDVELGYQHDRVQGSVNFFHSRQTDSITIDTSLPRWQYANLGTATFHGVETEGKFYVTKQVFILGSLLHQENESAGVQNITPIPNNTVKWGFSYAGDEGLTFGLFDNYLGAINGYTNPITINPAYTASHMIDAQIKFDVARYFQGMGSTGLQFVANVQNLTNNSLWLPDLGGGTGDTIPVNSGRTFFVGAQVSLNRNQHGSHQ